MRQFIYVAGQRYDDLNDAERCRKISGHVVYQAATRKTQTGTYSIQSNGTGTMSDTAHRTPKAFY